MMNVARGRLFFLGFRKVETRSMILSTLQYIQARLYLNRPLTKRVFGSDSFVEGKTSENPRKPEVRFVERLFDDSNRDLFDFDTSRLTNGSESDLIACVVRQKPGSFWGMVLKMANKAVNAIFSPSISSSTHDILIMEDEKQIATIPVPEGVEHLAFISGTKSLLFVNGHYDVNLTEGDYKNRKLISNTKLDKNYVFDLITGHAETFGILLNNSITRYTRLRKPAPAPQSVAKEARIDSEWKADEKKYTGSPHNEIICAAFHPRESHIMAIGFADGSVRLHNWVEDSPHWVEDSPRRHRSRDRELEVDRPRNRSRSRDAKRQPDVENTNTVLGCTFSSDGTKLATVDAEGCLKLWHFELTKKSFGLNSAEIRLKNTWQVQDGTLQSASFSSDGQYIAIVGQGDVWVLDVKNNTAMKIVNFETKTDVQGTRKIRYVRESFLVCNSDNILQKIRNDKYECVGCHNKKWLSEMKYVCKERKEQNNGICSDCFSVNVADSQKRSRQRALLTQTLSGKCGGHTFIPM